MPNAKKIFLYVISILMLVFIIAVLFVSYGTKYVIEKYDEKYIGRNITLSSAYVNILTGAIRFNNVSIYEFQSDSVFISADAIGINISLRKLLDHTFELSEITINHPAGIVIQNKKQLNITDLITKFTSKNDSGSQSYFEHINLLNVKIADGTFTFREDEIPIDYTIKKVFIESEGKRWDVDSVSAGFSFAPQSDSGDVKGKATINLKNLDYKLAISVHNFDLNIIAQYLKDITNYGTFKATLDADVNTNGNFNDEENVTIKGQIAINDFHFGKSAHDDFASFEKLILAIREISPKKFIYSYDSISLLHPYFKYERYEKLSNLETMFGQNGKNIAAGNADSAKFNLVIEIAKHIRVLSKNFFASHFKIDRLVLKDGEILFNDYSYGEKFSCALDPLDVNADSIDEKRNRVEVAFKAAIKPYGNATIALSINPKDSSDFDLKYNFNKMSAAMFNPYIVPLTSFPLDRGTVEINGCWHVTNGNILSNNHLVIIDPRISNRQKNNASKYFPMRLLMYFVREQGNVIDYEIPITGNLNNPKFQIRDVVMDAIENIFTKPVTTVYRTQVKNAESDIEKSFMLSWEMSHSSLNPKQEKFLRELTKFLVENPDVIVTISPQLYSAKEMEYLLFYEAKKSFFISEFNNHNPVISKKDSLFINKLSISDTLFSKYINKKVDGQTLFTMQEKCSESVDQNAIVEVYRQINSARKASFMKIFEERNLQNQVIMKPSKNVVPYNGLSFYKIDYTNELPQWLLSGYGKMMKLNNSPPRNKMKKKRKEIKL